MFKIVQKLAPAPPTDLYSPVAPLSETQNDDLFIYTIPFYNDMGYVFWYHGNKLAQG